MLSHFDGSRPGVIVVSPNADGTLTIVHVDTAEAHPAAGLIAYRSEVARARGLPEPENYETHTTARDPHALAKIVDAAL